MGSLSDRIEPVRLVSASAFLIAAGTLVAAVASNPAMMYAYYFCTGFGFGAISATFPTAIANYFGASSFSKNLGAGIFITTLIASTLPLIGGALFDATQSCTTAFFLAAGVVARVRGMRTVRSVPVPSARVRGARVRGRSVRGFFGRLRVGSHIGRRRWPMARRPARSRRAARTGSPKGQSKRVHERFHSEVRR